MRIVIDAGHGPDTPGKRTPDGSLREYQFNSVTAAYVIEMLKQYEKVEILTTYDDYRDVPLKERTDSANAWKADLYVSIHANAAGSGWNNAEGIETFVYTSRSPAAVALANAVQRQLIKLTGRQDRGVKSADFHVLRECKMTSILVECGFMTNRQEAELLKRDTYRQKCAMAVVTGIVETYGLKRKEAAPVENKPLPAIQKRIGVIVNGKTVGEGYLIDGVSYIPARTVSEQLGANVGYDGQNVEVRK
ncbi:N-acetylmuramoyl-L-alanine amidase [Paenibacillus thermotolerans]|uniref:N-acetylmuramoyl-L-alanine amidase n=1 Tax=Paenibacillus thermotolerans TaxID=3027807 RepID=UPI0023674AE6|nr:MULTISPECIES: N-acetylmuramoyl-L-alanine amidase [unclassified Paenibacillus]